MALQVWLPLNGNLNNQGLSNVTVTNSGATVNNAGKIGSCYGCKSNGYLSFPCDFGTVSEFTIAYWVKIPQTITTAAAWQTMIRFPSINDTTTATSIIDWASYNQMKIFDESNHQHAWITVPYNTWVHYAVVNKWDGTTNYIDIYQNGVNYGSYTSTKALKLTGGTWRIGEGINATYGPMYFNDFRVYDHCLSPKEVKEISKGLVLHYKLDDPWVEPTVNYGRMRETISVISGLESDWRIEKLDRDTVKVTALVNNPSASTYGNISGTVGGWLSVQAGNPCTLSCEIVDYKGSLSRIYPCSGGFGTIVGYKTFMGRVARTIVHTANWTHDLLIRTSDQANIKAGDYLVIRNTQIEAKDHATPYAPSTRAQEQIYDCSGYGRNGTIASTPTIASTTPRYSKCINFTDSATSIAIGIFPEIVPDGNFTFNCWFMKKTGEWSSKGYETIFGGPPGFELEAKNGSTNAPSLVPWNWGKNAITYELDKWNMVTFTRNTSETKLYLNGGETVTTGTAGSIPLGNYFIGAWSSASSQNYRGYLSDARIYSTVLSADDIKELYDTSAIIYNDGTVAAREAIETNNDNVDITKTGIISTQRFIECKDYLYLPAGNGVTTDLYYDNGDTCTAETIIRYASGGSGRDLMGFSGAAAGYWGVSSSGYWEIYGASSSYTDSDITKLNRIFYQYTAQTSVTGDHGYYQIGRLADTYSVRTKYIYNVKLYKNGTLERDLYPASNGTVAGLMDALHGTFYVATGTGSGRSSLGNDEEPTARFYKDHIQLNQIIEI